MKSYVNCIAALFFLSALFAMGDGIAALAERFGKPHSLQARFRQVKHMKFFAQPVELSGCMGLDPAKDRLAWHVREPVRYSILIDGKTIRQWDEAGGESPAFDASANPALGALLGQMRSWLSGDFANLEKEYELAVDGRKVACSPKGQLGQLVKRVELTLDETRPCLLSAKIEESSGDWTLVEFLETKLDEPFPRSLFSFGFDKQSGKSVR